MEKWFMHSVKLSSLVAVVWVYNLLFKHRVHEIRHIQIGVFGSIMWLVITEP